MEWYWWVILVALIPIVSHILAWTFFRAPEKNKKQKIEVDKAVESHCETMTEYKHRYVNIVEDKKR